VSSGARPSHSAATMIALLPHRAECLALPRGDLGMSATRIWMRALACAKGSLVYSLLLKEL
jgi:hypothetical protein